MNQKKVSAFFYGLYLEPAYSESLQITLSNPRKGYLADYQIDLKGKIKLTPQKGQQAWGLIYDLSLKDLQKMYAVEGAKDYQAFQTEIQLEENHSILAQCYNLPPGENDSLNREYLSKLIIALKKHKFPKSYILKMENL